MPWSETMRPVGMQRVALLVPAESLRDLLVEVADEGTVDFDDAEAGAGRGSVTPATALLQRLGSGRVSPARRNSSNEPLRP